MVYRGPSRGCVNCRRRRVKCDEGKPYCENCTARNMVCKGPRDIPKFRFRDETRHVLQRCQLSQIETQSDLHFTDDSPLQQDFLSLTSIAGHHEHVPVLLTTHTPRENGYNPFNCSETLLDSNMHHLLVFWQAYLHTPIWNDGITTSQPVSDAVWQSFVGKLGDNCQGHAVLVAAAAMHTLVTRSKRTAIWATRWRINVMRDLRAYLKLEHMRYYVVRTIEILMSGEIAAKDWPTVLLHSQFLAQMLQPRQDLQPPEDLCLTFIWLEIMRATYTFTHPVDGLWTISYARELICSSRDASNSGKQHDKRPNLDFEALADDKLARLFKEWQFASTAVAQHNIESEHSLEASIRLSISLQLLCGRFLLHSLTTSQQANNEKDSSQRSRFCQTAAASLAALHKVRLLITDLGMRQSQAKQTSMTVSNSCYWLRTLTYAEPLDQECSTMLGEIRQKFAVGPQIASRIQDLCQMSEDTIRSLAWQSTLLRNEGHEMRPELRLWLWIMHVGQAAERIAVKVPRWGTRPPLADRYNELLVSTGLVDDAEQMSKITLSFPS